VDTQTPAGDAAEFEARWRENPRAALHWLGQRRQTVSLFTTITNVIRARQIALTLFGRQFLIRFDPSRHLDPVDHVLWNILAFNLSGGIDRYSAQVEGFVAVLGFTVEIDLALSRIATGGLTVTASTPLFEASLTAGVYLPVPEEQPVRDA